MKKKIAVSIVLALAVLGVVWIAQAASYVFIGSLTLVNNTTSNLTSFAVGTVNLPRGTVSIAHNAYLGTTNDALVEFQASLDNTNFLTFYNWYSSTTASTTTNLESVSPSPSVTIYYRAKVTTTNSVFIGGSVSF